jgi:hypothetical protein
MDRRSFVRRAGLLAAGSALGGSLVACSDFEISIPCLGPAAPPTPVPGMTYIRASEIGCALDCDLGSGRNKYTGGAATDDGPRINTAMAGASATNPITLIIDGSAMISGLFLPAGGFWGIAGLGCGTGFFVKSGTNNDGIHNSPPDVLIPWDPGPPAPARGMNVSLSNFALNGNQGNGHDGNSTSGLRQGSLTAWYCGINLVNLDNITIENVVVVNTPAFHFRFSNVGNVAVTGCVMKSFGLSTDGLHFDGLANDVTISNCNFTTGDDAIALNCPEGYTGNITGVAVSNCTFNSLSLMRIYTTIGDYLNFYVNDVSVSNCNGSFSEAGFLLGLANGSFPNSISFTVSDCSLKTYVVLAMAQNFGTIALTNVTFIPTRVIYDWGLVPQSNHHCALLRPSPIYGGITYIGSNLAFNNCKIYREADIAVDPLILDYNSSIANLEFNGFAAQDAGSYSPIPGLIDIRSGYVGGLVLNELDSQNITTPVTESGFSSIGSVSGTGVLATGWEFPDLVMANNVPYISANSGLPSIKVGGVVKLYPDP